ncbi:hypothetical protein TNCV_1169361 [Trichonephila clavipes]|uniref:Uncharacterized protein n=1 Tax=Trichonephila clavipes TaxID=2585209 RepID=A0A8X6T5A5_TRICX|nr:hypothetical protein TNCV_1169361 [Trichonephila clavipes]
MATGSSLTQNYSRSQRSESDSTVTKNGSESDFEITDSFESSVSESEGSDDGSVLLRVMLAVLSHALKFISQEKITNVFLDCT